MNNRNTNSPFPQARRALLVSAVTLFAGALPALAQSGGAGSPNYGATPPTDAASPGTTGSAANENARRNNQPTSATGSGYHSGTAGADVDSTKEINARNLRNPQGSEKVSWSDRRFVTKAADAGQSELHLAQLAAERATNPDVKSFAQKLVESHTKANSELTALASQKSVKLDTDDDKDRFYNRLSKKSGADFDQEFVEHMIDEHEKDVRLFEKASNDAKDMEVRSFASNHVGHLREHLQTAQSLRQTLMPTGRLDASSGRSTPGGTTSTGSTTSSSATGGDYGTGSSATGTTGTTGTGTNATRRPDGAR